MFTGNDFPDLGGLIKTVGFLAVVVFVLGGYELIRLAIWLFQNVHIS